MPMSLLRKAIRLFKNDMVPKEQQRINQRRWLQSMQLLGDDHVLAKPVKRLPNPKRPVLALYQRRSYAF